ncbi:MAG TPA: outer membrane lipoprotein carrier protein LolA [Firmicutes bacterium]|nr:outer membrane lipoprotein carrier protein LolA [Bacillota bacterium]
MQAKKSSSGMFLVFRLPLLLLLLLALLLGLGYGGWRLYYGRYADRAGAIRRGMREHIEGLKSYHARFKTVPVGVEDEPTYSVELWREPPHRYRIEMSSGGEGRQQGPQVIIGDRDGAYYYDPESAGFIPLDEKEGNGVSGAFLENYWCSISEAADLNYIGEEKGVRHRYYQIEVIPSEPHRHRVSERVWLEQDSFLPVRIESFDAAGRLTQVTVFELLQLNPVLEAALFQVEGGRSP